MIQPGMDIIVVNHRTPDDLGVFCMSLASYRPKSPHHVWIVNVAPEDEDIHAGKLWSDALRASHVRIRDNVGYAAAVNATVPRGDREVIAVFNADVEITAQSLNMCYEAIMENLDWGILGPRQCDNDMTLTHAGIVGTRKAPSFRGWRAKEGNNYKDVVEVPTVMGAAMFIKRTCWNDLAECSEYREHLKEHYSGGELHLYGAMLPTQLYYEETFLCYHAQEHGWKVVYYGPVTMIHTWHQSIKANMDPREERDVARRSRDQFVAACDAVHGIPHD